MCGEKQDGGTAGTSEQSRLANGCFSFHLISTRLAWEEYELPILVYPGGHRNRMAECRRCEPGPASKSARNVLHHNPPFLRVTRQPGTVLAGH